MKSEAAGTGRRVLAAIACVSVMFLLGGVAFARQESPPQDPTMDCSLRIRNFAITAFVYADKHNGKLPPDLYTLFSSAAELQGKVGVQQVGEYARKVGVSPAHAGLLKPPAAIDAAWVNEGSSYKYLGNADVAIGDIQELGEIVIAHLRLDQGHPVEVSPSNPEGQVFTLAFLDGHVSIMTRAEAERVIAKSVATLDALRTGADAPPDRQAVLNIAMILKAIHAYSKAHDGKLPPDLGATLEYVPKDTKATATPKQRGRIYLSPKAQKSGSVPDEPTPDWVNANTGYVYIGAPDIKLDDIPEPYTLVLVHSRMQDAFTEADVNGERWERAAIGVAGGQAKLELKGYAEWVVRETQKTLGALRTGEGMPDWVHAMRDVRLIADAMIAYTKAHDGALPPTLGELAALLPENLRGVSGPGAAARVFLSPRAEATTQIPEKPTPEWITENAGYVYHAQPGARVPEMMQGDWLPLLHGRPEEAYRSMQVWEKEMVEVVPMSDAFGGCAMLPKEWLVQRLADPGTMPKSIGGKK